MAVEFRLLGDIQTLVDGRPVELGHARQRCVLVTLLLEANRVVSPAQLVDRVWGERPLPTRPANTLQTYVALLRRVLCGTGEVTIDWRNPGYRLTVDPAAVDVLRFHDLLARARAARDDERAAELLEGALGLWRGDPFGTLETPWLDLVRATLSEQRHAARLDLADIRLRQGRHAAILAELSESAEASPLDERLAGQLILALHRGGRSADALRHYERIRHRLAEELGVDPAPPLRRLRQQVLTADPALSLSGETPVPRQLPAPPWIFVGRSAELERLDAALARPGAVVISAISGTGGIGKSWLALQWAHAHAEQFPDGQLFVNLRGFDPTGEPLSPDVAVRGFLGALGVPESAVPDDPQARAAHYRSLLAGRRMLVVLDNARDSAQVEGLLPGSPSCAVLITSRRHLAGLATAHGAHTVELDVLPGGEAAALLHRHLGDRTAAEPRATAELLAACAGLPLALGIVAVRAAHNPFPLAVLAEELRESAARLDALDGGDLAASVRGVLSWSCDALAPASAKAFGLLGLFPGPDIGLPAAASLLGTPPARARNLLRDLENAHLVQQHRPGRYRMHDLIRLYAAERAKLEHPQHDRCAALYRLVDHYLHTAAAGELLLHPRGDAIGLAPPAPGSRPEPLADQASAMAWFEAEHLCLLAAQQLAARYERYSIVLQVPWTLGGYHRRSGRFEHQYHAWLAGLAAAERLEDREAQTEAHRRIAVACARIARHAGESERAAALAECGWHLAWLGRYPAALRCWRQAYELYRGQHRVADADRIRRQLAELRAGTRRGVFV